MMYGAGRIVAAITALGCFMLVITGAAATLDAGALKGQLSSLAVFAGAGAASLWILLCSVLPTSVAACLPARPVLRVLVVQLPVYAAALAGAASVLWAIARG